MTFYLFQNNDNWEDKLFPRLTFNAEKKIPVWFSLIYTELSSSVFDVFLFILKREMLAVTEACLV